MRNRIGLSVRLAGAAVSIAALFALSGCVGASTGSAQKQPVNTPSSATLAASPTSLSFSAVAVGNSVTLPLTVANTSSSATATVSQLTISGTGYSLVSPPSLPATLTPGQQLNLTIKFTPPSGGSLNGNLQIVSDASNSPTNVACSGTGVAPGQLAASPSSMNFGNVMIGNNAQAQGLLTAGSSDIIVSSAAWSGTGYTVTGITFPVTVPAGKSVAFTVTFTPQTSGTSNGSVSFYSNASNSPAVENWTGIGTQQPQPHTVALSWNPSISQVVGYNVYRGTVSGGPYGKLNSVVDANTAYTDPSVKNGTTYYYVTTAVDSKGQESTYSNEAQAIIPQN